MNVTIVAYPARFALLLSDVTGVHASLSLSLSNGGLLTGILRDEENRRVRFLGKIAAGASSATVLLKGGGSLALTFDTPSRLSATLTTEEQVLTGAANIAMLPAPEIRGRYTMALDTGSGGFGWCVLIVDALGNFRVTGKLPDGSSISAGQGLPIDGESNAPVFIVGSPRAMALLSGSLHFATKAQSDVAGILNFRKAGIDARCEAIGAHFTKAPSALSPGSYPLVLEGNGVNETSSVTLRRDNTATVLNPAITITPGGGAGLPANGLFTGQFLVDQTAGTPISGTGVFIQKLGKGFGQFRKEGATGEIRIGE